MLDTPPDVSCAQVLKVLADETRFAVVRLLMSGAQHVGELNERINVDQSLLSHHLRLLRESGLVVSERDGKHVLYRLAPNVEAKRQGATLNLGCCQLVFE